jgi:hypothetical protein
MGVPASRTRREAFGDLVLDTVESLERRWAAELDGVEFAVEDVPPSETPPWPDDGVPLGRLFPADGRLPHRIVVYRRPIETRAGDRSMVASVVHEVVVEQVACLLGVEPTQVDPRLSGDD